MKAMFRITDPNEVEMELIISMPLGIWKNLREQLALNYPSLKLRLKITDMILHAEKHFNTEEIE